MRPFALLLLAAMASVAQGQDLVVEKTEVRFEVAGKTAKLDVRYPRGVAVPRPTVVINHGWAASGRDYADMADHLCARGFVVALLDQPDRMGNSTPAWARVLRATLDELTRIARDPAHRLWRRIDPARFGLMGHSYGGAAVVWAAAEDPRVKAVVGLAPVNQPHRKELQERASRVTVPLLVIVGTSDWLSNRKADARPIYDRAASASHRQYLEVRGGGHNFHRAMKDKRGALGRRYWTAWFVRFLLEEGDPEGFTTGAAAERDQAAKKLADVKVARRTRGLAGVLGSP